MLCVSLMLLLPILFLGWILQLPFHTGAPVVASFPHFHLADEKYVAAIEGMSPQGENHQTFLDLNPVSLQVTVSPTIASAVVISNISAVWLFFVGHTGHLNPPFRVPKHPVKPRKKLSSFPIIESTCNVLETLVLSWRSVKEIKLPSQGLGNAQKSGLVDYIVELLWTHP